MLKVNSADELFVKLAKQLRSAPLVEVRGLAVKELLNVNFELTNPLASWVTLKARNASKDYWAQELTWYLSGSLDVKDIAHASKFWLQLADDNGQVESNYGRLCLHDRFYGLTQVEFCLEELKKDLMSRKAVINYNQPKHKKHNSKDFVCTICQGFQVRNYKLHSSVVMRSCDLIYGLTYDINWFSYLMQLMAKELKLKVGSLNWFGFNLHVYTKHFEMLNKIAKETYA